MPHQPKWLCGQGARFESTTQRARKGGRAFSLFPSHQMWLHFMLGHRAILTFLYPSDVGERRPQIFLPPLSLGKAASGSFVQSLNKYSLSANSEPSSFLINGYAINTKTQSLVSEDPNSFFFFFQTLIGQEDIQITRLNIELLLMKLS